MSVAVSGDAVGFGHGTRTALAPSTFSIPAGKVTAVIGPNGAGKSTLLNGIAGLIRPYEGTIRVAAERARISYVLQTTRVNDALPISVSEVVMMGRYARAGAYRWIDDADRSAVAEAIDRMGIAELAGRQLKDLSAGQRQRVFVAQGLAQSHDLLLLDEPMTGVDLPTAQAIDAVIHDEIGRGCTVVLTTHDLSEAQVADNVMLLAGRLVACGPPDEALRADNVRSAYGAALLHAQDGRVFLDDAAHSHETERHVHRDMSIHTEADPEGFHSRR